jgi:hypothetical protein
MAKKSKKPAPSRRPQDRAKPAAPAPAAKGPHYELGYLYGQLGNAIKAAISQPSPKKK